MVKTIRYMNFKHISVLIISTLLLGTYFGIIEEQKLASDNLELERTNTILHALVNRQNLENEQQRKEIQILEESVENHNRAIEKLEEQITQSDQIIELSGLNWLVEPQTTKTDNSSEDLSDEQNTVGDDLQYTHYSNQSSTSNNKTNVILISLDGFSRQRFNQYKENLTTINNLLAEGWLQFNVTNGSYYTQTKNGHATMLSGYLGTETGIYGNGFVYNQLPVGYTFLEKAEQKYGSNQIASAFISGKYKNMYPAFNKTALEEFDFVSIQEQTTAETADLCLSFLEEYGNTHFTAFFHFRDPDKTGHKFIEGSNEWKNNLTAVDEQLNRIITKLNEKDVLNRTLIYLTTDHGFKTNEQNHPHEPYIWLLTNDQNTSTNLEYSFIGVQDIAPTICYALNLPYNYSEIQNGQPLQQAYPNEKTSFRLQYLVDNDSQPLMKILYTKSTDQSLKLWVQLSADVNQLYLISDKDDYDGSILEGKKIPLETSIIKLEIDFDKVTQHDELYLLAYDFAENLSMTRIDLE